VLAFDVVVHALRAYPGISNRKSTANPFQPLANRSPRASAVPRFHHRTATSLVQKALASASRFEKPYLLVCLQNVTARYELKVSRFSKIVCKYDRSLDAAEPAIKEK
jgi:hypothetical protein